MTETCRLTDTDAWDHVILVDESDRELGIAEKLAAHESGKLHRAFSVFVFNPRGDILLQQRAFGKYHSPGIWTNTCCSHPRQNRELTDEARLRLRFEMGIDCPVTEVFSFVYRAEFENGLIEHEFDHVLFGEFDGVPQPDPNEVADWAWKSPTDIRAALDDSPEMWSPWLRACFDEVLHQHDIQRRAT